MEISVPDATPVTIAGLAIVSVPPACRATPSTGVLRSLPENQAPGKVMMSPPRNPAVVAMLSVDALTAALNASDFAAQAIAKLAAEADPDDMSYDRVLDAVYLRTRELQKKLLSFGDL